MSGPYILYCPIWIQYDAEVRSFNICYSSAVHNKKLLKRTMQTLLYESTADVFRILYHVRHRVCIILPFAAVFR